MFDFKAFFLGLPKDQREAFAKAAGTSVDYVNLHLIRGRRVPRPALMHALVAACVPYGASPTVADLAAFFFQVPAPAATQESAGA